MNDVYDDDMSLDDIDRQMAELQARIEAKAAIRAAAEVDPRDAEIAELRALVASQAADTAAQEKAVRVAALRSEIEMLKAAAGQAEAGLNAQLKELGATENKKVTFQNMAEAEADEPALEWLIEGIFERRKTVVLIGPPGHGKSTVAFDWAASIASGKNFHGKQVQQGAVFYLAAEDDAGTKARSNAWRVHNSVNLNTCPLYIASCTFHADAEEDVAEVEQVIAGIREQTGARPSLIVIDTLSCCFSGDDENNSAEMAKFLAGVTRLRNGLDVTVLILHHPTKSNVKNARGSGSLQGHVDREYFVVKDEKSGIIEFSPGKLRGVYSGPRAFALQSVDLQLFERDGTPTGYHKLDNFSIVMRSCVLEETELPEDDEDFELKPKKLTKDDRAWELLKFMVADAGGPVDMSEWRTEVARQGICDISNFARTRKNLVGAGRVVEEDGKVYAPGGEVSLQRAADAKDATGGGCSRPGLHSVRMTDYSSKCSSLTS
jgi:KaiC/GvpD/RAD55 family RecA-like ATPase